MNKILILFFAFVTVFASCKEEEVPDTNTNTLKIMQGQYAGTTFRFDPNIAYWSEVNMITRSIRLQFGDTDSPPSGGTGTGDMFFYYSEGKQNIAFPSAEGQYMRFVLKLGSEDRILHDKDVHMIVKEFNNEFIRGTISGEMCIDCTSDSTSSIYMEFKVNTQKQ